MKRTEQSLISELLDAAKSAGADGADAMLARGEGTSIDLRLGKIEASERSGDLTRACEFLLANATLPFQLASSTARISNRWHNAIAMAKVAPDDPYARLATQLSWPNSCPSWKCMMNTFQQLMI